MTLIWNLVRPSSRTFTRYRAPPCGPGRSAHHDPQVQSQVTERRSGLGRAAARQLLDVAARTRTIRRLGNAEFPGLGRRRLGLNGNPGPLPGRRRRAGPTRPGCERPHPGRHGRPCWSRAGPLLRRPAKARHKTFSLGPAPPPPPDGHGAGRALPAGRTGPRMRAQAPPCPRTSRPGLPRRHVDWHSYKQLAAEGGSRPVTRSAARCRSR